MKPLIIDWDSLRENCVELYCLIASPVPEEKKEDPIADAYVHFYRYKISVLLLDIAIRARVVDDILARNEDECRMGKRQFHEAIGTYEKGESGELGLRASLNKIIHANFIELICDGIEDEYQEEDMVCRAHTGRLKLTGKKGEETWSVLLSPVAVCREILHWLDLVEENSRLHKLYQ